MLQSRKFWKISFFVSQFKLAHCAICVPNRGQIVTAVTKVSVKPQFKYFLRNPQALQIKGIPRKLEQRAGHTATLGRPYATSVSLTSTSAVFSPTGNSCRHVAPQISPPRPVRIYVHIISAPWFYFRSIVTLRLFGDVWLRHESVACGETAVYSRPTGVLIRVIRNLHLINKLLNSESNQFSQTGN